MESYIQLNQNGKKVYKPIIAIAFNSAVDSELPYTFDKKIPDNKKMRRTINEIWYVKKDPYFAGKFIKTLIWEQYRRVEIMTELGNTLKDDPVGEKYFIREDPVTDALINASQNHLSATFIKEDKNAIHLPVDAEEEVPLTKNELDEDIIDTTKLPSA